MEEDKKVPNFVILMSNAALFMGLSAECDGQQAERIYRIQSKTLKHLCKATMQSICYFNKYKCAHPCEWR